MSPWPFIVAAYALTLGAAAVITLMSWRSMKAAEIAVDDLPRR